MKAIIELYSSIKPRRGLERNGLSLTRSLSSFILKGVLSYNNSKGRAGYALINSLVHTHENKMSRMQ